MRQIERPRKEKMAGRQEWQAKWKNTQEIICRESMPRTVKGLILPHVKGNHLAFHTFMDVGRRHRLSIQR